MPRTYEKRLGVKNVDQIPAVKGPNEGEIFEWFTFDGVVACYPDRFEGEMDNLERIPDEITEIHYIGKE